MNKQFAISLGAFTDPIKEQLKDQGFGIADENELHHFEKDRLALGRIYMRGLITEVERDKAAMRLLKKMRKHVKELA